MCIFITLQEIQQQQAAQQNTIRPNYQMVLNSQKMSQQNANRHSIPVPVINVQTVPNKQIMRCNTPISNTNIKYSNIMSPLSLNIGSPGLSLPSSPGTPNYSPAMSPAQRVLSPYSTPQSLSPVGKYSQMYSPGNRLLSPAGVIQGSDPYLTNKMQTSPGFPIQPNDLLLDSNVSLGSSDFWAESEMLQGTNDLLSAFDDVKLG